MSYTTLALPDLLLPVQRFCHLFSHSFLLYSVQLYSYLVLHSSSLHTLLHSSTVLHTLDLPLASSLVTFCLVQAG